MSEGDPREAAGAPQPGEAQGAAAGGGQPSEEELRARLEEELRRVTVRDVLLQTVVSLVNLSGQRLGLTPDTRDLRDLEQARLGIEAVRAVLPLLEQQDAAQVRPVRDALAQLQIAYAREAGAAAPGPGPGGEGSGAREPAGGPEPGAPADRGAAPGTAAPPRAGGRLWVPPGSDV